MGTDRSSDSGGAKSALDLTDEKDRGMVRRFLTRHKKRVPGIDPERIAGWLSDLDLVRKTARETITNGGDFYPIGEGGTWDTKLDGAKVLGSAIKTEAMLEGMNQADDHKEAQLESDRDRPTGLTINAENVNVAALAQVANNPDAYAQFAKLADTVKQGGTDGPDRG